MLPHPLTNFETQKYYQNEPNFTGVFSRKNSSKIKNGAYIINFDEYEWIVTQWIALYVNAKKVTCFDGFGVVHIPKKVRKFIENKKVIKNTYRIQAYDSIMCGYFCIRFIDFKLKGIRVFKFISSERI